MSANESGPEYFSDPERVIAPSEHAFLEYLLEDRESKLVELETENDWLRHDQLTGALVANVIRGELAKKVDQASETGKPFALIFGDVDNLKVINTRHGYREGGDAILAAIGRSFRTGDLIGRAGGDELWWIADITPREEYYADRPIHLHNPSPNQLVAQMAKRFEERANVEIRLLEFGPDVGFSVGYAIYEEGDTDSSLITRAEQNLRVDKDHNKAIRLSQSHHPSKHNPQA